MDVSHALMEVMCEQLQNILHNFQQQQIAERGTAEGLESSNKSTNQAGVAYLGFTWIACQMFSFYKDSVERAPLDCFFHSVLMCQEETAAKWLNLSSLTS